MSEPVLVWKNGTLLTSGLGSFDMKGSTCEFRFVRDTVLALCALNRLSSPVKGMMAEIEEFLCLCLVLRRDVKLSSKGFISGGSREILRNITIR